MQPNIRKRLEMNLFLQEGICISPPFPKTEAVCNSSVRPVIVEGYYNEMHNFDYIDYSLVNSAESLKNEFNKRQARLQNCTHEWDQNEINMVMKPLASMSVTGW